MNPQESMFGGGNCLVSVFISRPLIFGFTQVFFWGITWFDFIRLISNLIYAVY